MASTGTRTTDHSGHADDGTFRHPETAFRDHVTADGGSGYRAEAGRYHLYVSYACPWAHRTIIYRHLKGLEDAVSMTVVDPERDERGWAITDAPGTTPDPVNHFAFLSESYAATDPEYAGRISVPVLWDRRSRRIVNNESAEIIRMFEREFDAFAQHPERHYLPDDLRAEIDELNEFVYENVNDGVYRTGFARTQEAYEHGFGRLFDALDALDARLATRRYLMGAAITEADWRLFTTLVRFDPVYVGHFQCNLRRIADYPQLSGYLRDLYQHPGIAATVDMDHIKRHYYRTHPSINPRRIVPVGPALDLTAPHGRERAGGERRPTSGGLRRP
jgi:glutathionyl-hydroquinone reductase